MTTGRYQCLVVIGGEKISTVRSETWCQFLSRVPLLVHGVGRYLTQIDTHKHEDQVQRRFCA